MKAFLLIAAAAVTIGAGPALAGGTKTMKSSSAAMPAATAEAKPPALLPGGCAHNQPMCGGWVQSQDGRMVRPNRNQQDAREQAVTNNLNIEAQGAAGVGIPAGMPAPQFSAVPVR